MRNEELGPVYQFILEELKIPLDSEIEREYSIRIGERLFLHWRYEKSNRPYTGQEN